MTLKIKGLSQYKSYANLEEEGVFVDITPDLQWKIRRLRSKPVMDAREKIYGPYERGNRTNTKLPEGVETICTIKLLSSAVVVAWRSRPEFDEKNPKAERLWADHMVNDDGQTIPFSVEACSEILSDPEVGKDLRSTVINLASEGDVFTPEAIAQDSGNSAAS